MKPLVLPAINTDECDGDEEEFYEEDEEWEETTNGSDNVDEVASEWVCSKFVCVCLCCCFFHIQKMLRKLDSNTFIPLRCGTVQIFVGMLAVTLSSIQVIQSNEYYCCINCVSIVC